MPIRERSSGVAVPQSTDETRLKPFAPRLPSRRYLSFGAPSIGEAAIAEVVDSLRSGWIGTGPKVARFEEAFRRYTGAAHAVAVSSCTAALHLSMLAAGVREGDEVITTTMTFSATVSSILHAGGRPVLVDCDRHTHLIDPQRVQDAITPRTRAIVPVHLAGRVCNMEALADIANCRGLLLIEDAAHAIEGIYRNGKIGNISPLTCFSFYATKNITTAEGGMVTTNDRALARQIKMLALHGLSDDAWRRYADDGYRHYEVVYPGFKCNMTDLQAAIGIHQFAHIEKWLGRRQEIWRRYDAAFTDLPIGLPAPDDPDSRHARHLYRLEIDERECGITRNAFMQRLHELGIGTGVHYVAVHLQPYFRETFGFKREDFPNASSISDRTVSIPLSPHLTDGDVDDVIAAVRLVIRGGQ